MSDNTAMQHASNLSSHFYLLVDEVWLNYATNLSLGCAINVSLEESLFKLEHIVKESRI